MDFNDWASVALDTMRSDDTSEPGQQGAEIPTSP
jgi:hypothetical protein